MSESRCPFCNVDEKDIVLKNDKCFAIFDKYPVSKGHMLIVPYRHFSNFFDTTYDEISAIYRLVYEAKSYLDKEFSPDGYNLGINIGKAAGQTIPHMHIHLIPRYKGDMEDPTGGVRGVIPAKRVYPF